jgi:hypothetical protein
MLNITNKVKFIIIINLVLIMSESCQKQDKCPNALFVKIKLSNGKTAIKGVTINGKKEGLWLDYDYDGNLVSQSIYFNDKLNGESIGYYETGNILSDGLMKDGLRDGNWIVYFNNGKIAEKGRYLNDKKVGVWEYYINAGLLNKKIEYSKDVEKVILDNHYLPPPPVSSRSKPVHNNLQGDSTARVIPANK